MSVDYKFRVLIVDDDPSVVKLLGHFVADLSFEPLGAVDPQDALNIAARQEIQIALIDLHMPDMSGTQLIKALRRLNSDTEFILITGDSSSATTADAIDNGYDCIWKPIDFDRLEEALNTIRDHVQRRLRNNPTFSHTRAS
jgi:DNA-binding NtrC family response regulator